jgi:hypothetical protein
MHTPRYRAAAVLVFVTFAGFGGGLPASAQKQSLSDPAHRAACEVEGVWEQVSVAFDGKKMPPYSRPPRKIVAHGHWIWIGADAGRDRLPRQTEAERLRATQMFGGAGTYTTTDRTFTQKIDYFFDPKAEGATLLASCRTDGQFWYYSYSTAGVPGMDEGPKRVSEVWRRLQ